MNSKKIVKVIIMASIILTLSLVDPTVIYYIPMLLIHELTHCIVGMRLGYSINKLHIQPFGVSASFNEEFIKPLDDIIISVSGPLINFVFFVLFFNLSYLNEAFAFLSRANAVLCIFNLLPAGFLDGGRIIKNVLKIFLSFHSAYLITNINGIILGCSIVIAGLSVGINIKTIILIILGAFFIYTGVVSQKEIIINIIKDALHKQTYICSWKKVKICTEVYSSECKLFDIIKGGCFHNYRIIYVSDNGRLGKKYEEFEIVDTYCEYGNKKLREIY